VCRMLRPDPNTSILQYFQEAFVDYARMNPDAINVQLEIPSKGLMGVLETKEGREKLSQWFKQEFDFTDESVSDFERSKRGWNLALALWVAGQTAKPLEAGIRNLGKAGSLTVEDVVYPTAKYDPSFATRQRVLQNIGESRAAREASKFELYAAKESQIMAGYSPDVWEFGRLEKGSIVYGGLPGQSSFYTDFAAVKASGLKASDLFGSTQVSPHSVYGYRRQIGAYRVLETIEVPQSKALANPAFGAGGKQQYWIKEYDKLEKIRTFNLSH